MDSDVYENTRDAGAAIGVSYDTIQTWIRSGRLKAERIPRAGRVAFRIRHVDLIEASRGTMFQPEGNAPQLRLDTPEDPDRHALTLEVFWPAERRAQPFHSDILAGFKTFRAITYTVSLPSILKLLTTQDYDLAEVVFGSELLVRETSAEKVVLFQAAIEDELARGYVGIGGVSDQRSAELMAWQAQGRARFYAAAGGVIHSKLYFLERPGLRRVLVGSANLSDRAMSGRQGEVLMAYDNDDWVWTNLIRKYDAARSLANGLQLKGEYKPAHLVRAEDTPAGRETKEHETVNIYTFEKSDMPGDPEYIELRSAELESNLGEALRENIKPMPHGQATIHKGVLKRVNDAAAPKRTGDPKQYHHLRRVDHAGGPARFIYDGRPIDRPVSNEGIARDALLISQYMDKFQELGRASHILQRNYYGFMGWLYFAPFMPNLARQLHLAGGNASKDLKHLAVIYGQSNCGKSALVKFLLTSMFEPPATVADSGFTQSDFQSRSAAVGVLPIYYQDVSVKRFAGRAANQGENIIKYYDQLVNMTSEYPCAVATANSEVAEFSNEVRNRAFLVYTPKGIASDDGDTRQRIDKEVLPLLNRIGQDFYAEYMHRMAAIMAQAHDGDWDYLLESTTLIKTMLIEHLKEDEVLPAWVKPVTANEFDGLAWELKHEQMASRLSSKLYTVSANPPEGYWTATPTEILIGVSSVRDVLMAKEVQDHWVKRESMYGSGKVLHLHRDEVEASIRRSRPRWRLYVPLLRRIAMPSFGRQQS